MKKIVSHRELDVYKLAFDAAMEIFKLTKDFPLDEKFSLTSQIRRASRSVCGNLAEAWRKRRYEAAFVSKLCDCEGEAAEVQTWLEFSVKCEYMDPQPSKKSLFNIRSNYRQTRPNDKQSSTVAPSRS